MNSKDIASQYVMAISRLELGETCNINHIDCPAGTDTKARLYITKPIAEPDAVLVYCHNCQEGTKFKTKPNGGYRIKPPTIMIELDTASQSGLKQLPFEEADINKWPEDAATWVKNTGLSQNSLYTFDIGYCPSYHRICLPIYNRIILKEPKYSDLIGAQYRRLTIEGPKYITSRVNKDSELYTMIVGKEGPLDMVFIVEDLVSGIRIMEVLGPVDGNFGVLVNYGVAVQPTVLLKIPETKQIVVWLDNDNDHVKTQAENMKRTLQLLHPKATISKSVNTDPKKLLKDKNNCQLFRTNVRALL